MQDWVMNSKDINMLRLLLVALAIGATRGAVREVVVDQAGVTHEVFPVISRGEDEVIVLGVMTTPGRYAISVVPEPGSRFTQSSTPLVEVEECIHYAGATTTAEMIASISCTAAAQFTHTIPVILEVVLPPVFYRLTIVRGFEPRTTRDWRTTTKFSVKAERIQLLATSQIESAVVVLFSVVDVPVQIKAVNFTTCFLEAMSVFNIPTTTALVASLDHRDTDPHFSVLKMRVSFFVETSETAALLAQIATIETNHTALMHRLRSCKALQRLNTTLIHVSVFSEPSVLRYPPHENGVQHRPSTGMSNSEIVAIVFGGIILIVMTTFIIGMLVSPIKQRAHEEIAAVHAAANSDSTAHKLEEATDV